jgi:YVTN family beta-propeller protein
MPGRCGIAPGTKVLLCGLAVLLSACGGGDDDGGGGPSNSLVVTPQILNLADCEADQISATLYDGDGDPVVGATFAYNSTAPGVAIVAGGTVTAVAVGTASVIVTSGQLADTVTVTVAPALNTITINPDSLAVFEGISRLLVPTFLDCHGAVPAGATLTYLSADPLVATYDAGTFTAIDPGTTTLRVSDGTVSDSFKLTVRHTPVLTGSPLVGDRPFGIASSASLAYVTRLDAAAVSAATLPGSAFDPVGFAVGSTPTDVAFSPSGLKAYVTNQGNGTIGVIDVLTSTQIDTIQTVGSPFRVLFNAIGDRAFVTTAAGNVHVINTSTDAIITTVQVQGAPNGMVFSNDNSRLYVSHTNGNVHVLDALTYAPIDTLDLTGPLQDMGMSADGLTLYVADESGFIRYWNLPAGNVALSQPAPAFGLKVSPNKELIYLAGGGTVTLIDAATLEVVSSIIVGGNARRIAFSNDGLTAFVTNEAGYVSVIQ